MLKLVSKLNERRMVKDSKTGEYNFSRKKDQNFEWKTTLIKGPLKYLVAKLRGCYASAI